jgi:HD-like signal output (HDOD) protein
MKYKITVEKESETPNASFDSIYEQIVERPYDTTLITDVIRAVNKAL